jgi:hypothetical protein
MSNSVQDFCKQDGRDLKELLTAQINNIKTLIDANDKNYNQRFENVINATQAALAAADRAVNKAEMASEKRFEAVNEFRATLADQQRNLMPRGEVEILVKGINDRIEILSLQQVTRVGQALGVKEGWGWAVGVLGIVTAMIAVTISFIK